MKFTLYPRPHLLRIPSLSHSHFPTLPRTTKSDTSVTLYLSTFIWQDTWRIYSHLLHWQIAFIHMANVFTHIYCIYKILVAGSHLLYFFTFIALTFIVFTWRIYLFTFIVLTDLWYSQLLYLLTFIVFTFTHM